MSHTIDSNVAVEDADGQGLSGTYCEQRATLFFEDIGSVDAARIAEFRGPLKHVGLCRYFGKEAVKGYIMLAFEGSDNKILEFRFGIKSFGFTQEIIRHIIKGIVYLHSIDYLHTALESPSSYVLYQDEGMVVVKLSVFQCYAIGSPGAANHSKESNIKDFCCFMMKFFCCNDVDLEVSRTYNSSTDLPPIRFIPFVESQRIYVAEVLDFIKCGALLPPLADRKSLPSGSKVDPMTLKIALPGPLAAREFLNHPLLWTPERRLNFLCAASEYCKTLPADDAFLEALDRISWFHDVVGPYWMNLEAEFRADLRAPCPPVAQLSPHPDIPNNVILQSKIPLCHAAKSSSYGQQQPASTQQQYAPASYGQQQSASMQQYAHPAKSSSYGQQLQPPYQQYGQGYPQQYVQGYPQPPYPQQYDQGYPHQYAQLHQPYPQQYDQGYLHHYAQGSQLAQWYPYTPQGYPGQQRQSAPQQPHYRVPPQYAQAQGYPGQQRQSAPQQQHYRVPQQYAQAQGYPGQQRQSAPQQPHYRVPQQYAQPVRVLAAEEDLVPGRDTKTSVVDFIRHLRNFLSHDILLRSVSETKVEGIKEYTKYDEEACKGFDMYLNAKIPFLFMDVFSVFRGCRRARLQRSLENFLEPSFDPSISDIKH